MHAWVSVKMCTYLFFLWALLGKHRHSTDDKLQRVRPWISLAPRCQKGLQMLSVSVSAPPARTRIASLFRIAFAFFWGGGCESCHVHVLVWGREPIMKQSSEAPSHKKRSTQEHSFPYLKFYRSPWRMVLSNHPNKPQTLFGRSPGSPEEGFPKTEQFRRNQKKKYLWPRFSWISLVFTVWSSRRTNGHYPCIGPTPSTWTTWRERWKAHQPSWKKMRCRPTRCILFICLSTASSIIYT